MNENSIHWSSADTHFLINKRSPQYEMIQSASVGLPRLPYHIWLASSGSQSGLSLYALHKTGFLVSAEAVNTYLGLMKEDVWLNVLPLFHVGGLSILARSFLLGSRVVHLADEGWDAQRFHEVCRDQGVTVTALVPTQLFDLVQSGERCPPSLRMVIVGGAKLELQTYTAARRLGYVILPSYGMTECCSQIATASPYMQKKVYVEGEEFPTLYRLPHVQLATTDDGRLMVQSRALFTIRADWHAGEHRWEILYRAGDWYTTADRVELQKLDELRMSVKPIGRQGDQVKIMGEWVNLVELQSLFQQILFENSVQAKVVVLTQDSPRRGEEVIVVLESKNYSHSQEWIRQFNERVLPVARIQSAFFVDEIPKSELGKIRRQSLPI